MFQDGYPFETQGVVLTHYRTENLFYELGVT